MELQDFIEKFSDLFEDTDPNVLTPNCNFLELEEWSSLLALTVIALVKTEYGIKITAKDLRTCKTIQNLFNFINKK